jgi:hypothetical protein
MTVATLLEFLSCLAALPTANRSDRVVISDVERSSLT